jgi:hypothetical protein
LSTKANASSGLPRYDSFFNPGVELTPEEMSAQLTSRIATSTTFAEATYSVEEDFDTLWANHLGKTIVFTGTAGTEYAGFNITVRCVSVSASCSNGSVQVGLMVKQPRYPVLPKDRRRGQDDKDASSKNPIVKAEKPNKPKDAFTIPTFDTDDWDKKPGQDTPTALNINVDNVFQNTEQLNYANQLWYQGIEGHTIIPDDAAGRFIAINYSSMATMWPGKASRGSLVTLTASKSRKLASRPTVNPNDIWSATSEQLGLTGTRGEILNLDWATISGDALSGTLTDYDLLYEVFNFTLSLYGPVASRKVLVTAHQLQLFSGASDNKVRSKDFSYVITVDANLDPTNALTPTSASPYKGNTTYDADWTFFAYGNQIASETSGDIDKTVVMTPRAYPKDQNFPKPSNGVYDNNYWASLNMGAYATWNIYLVKNWTNGSNDSGVGPSIAGENYRQLTILPIPWIDQSRIINNVFGCVVMGQTVYAHAMTEHGRDVQGAQAGMGENRIVKAEFLTKPSQGLSNWTQIYSGRLPKSYTGGQNSMTSFTFTWKRNANEIAFFDTKTDGNYTKVLAKNGVNSVRELIPSNALDIWPITTSFTNGNYEPTDSFSDFYGFTIASYQGFDKKWIAVDGFDYAIFLWNGQVSGNGDTQNTLPNKCLRGSNFTVSIYGCNQPGMGYDRLYGRCYVFWTWEP